MSLAKLGAMVGKLSQATAALAEFCTVLNHGLHGTRYPRRPRVYCILSCVFYALVCHLYGLVTCDSRADRSTLLERTSWDTLLCLRKHDHITNRLLTNIVKVPNF
jgi:hypothetical protein